MEKRPSVGGQAVMEGVMMKGPDKYALAVRTPDKQIDVTVHDYKAFGDKCKLFKLPIIRGVVNFAESLVIGMKTLLASAEYYEELEEKIEKENTSDDSDLKNIENDSKDKKGTEKKDDEDISVFLIVLVSVVIAIGLFMLLPTLAVQPLGKVIDSSALLGLVEGLVRLLIFITYVWAISKMEDIKRTFMYHGAEHKTINCFESGEELTVENVMKHTRFHKRCGTSFLFVVMFVSILVFMCIRTDVFLLKIAYRLLLVPVIAGISYEFIRFAGRNDGVLANILSKPGLWTQRLTTIEPTPDMVEVAIESVKAVVDVKKWENKA